MKRIARSVVGSLCVAFAAACASAGNEGGGNDSGISGFADANPTAPDATAFPDAMPLPDVMMGDVVLTESTSPIIEAGNGRACIGGFNRESSYYRTFDLVANNINSSFQVKEVRIGIESASVSIISGSDQDAALRLHTLTSQPGNSFLRSQLTQLISSTIDVNDTGATVLPFSMNAVVPAGRTLVVELLVPTSDQFESALLFIGANDGGEQSPTYVRWPDCGVSEPTAAGTVLGPPPMNWVVTVVGAAI